ncbi:UNVERIFIED_CONTAM: hypothetical protein K2H54_028064 [Gekko kuhli]
MLSGALTKDTHVPTKGPGGTVQKTVLLASPLLGLLGLSFWPRKPVPGKMRWMFTHFSGRNKVGNEDGASSLHPVHSEATLYVCAALKSQVGDEGARPDCRERGKLFQKPFRNSSVASETWLLSNEEKLLVKSTTRWHPCFSSKRSAFFRKSVCKDCSEERAQRSCLEDSQNDKNVSRGHLAKGRDKCRFK